MKHKIQTLHWISMFVILIAAQAPIHAKSVSNRSAPATQVQTGDVISEWHQEAVRLIVLPASNLAPVQQTRAMAIVQVAVHDAVNGYTSEYETYLRRVYTYEVISPEAAAIAASYHALRTLFPTQAASH